MQSLLSVTEVHFPNTHDKASLIVDLDTAAASAIHASHQDQHNPEHLHHCCHAAPSATLPVNVALPSFVAPLSTLLPLPSTHYLNPPPQLLIRPPIA